MEFEKIRREALQSDERQEKPMPLGDRKSLAQLLAALPLKDAKQIAEISPARGEVAMAFLSASTATYAGIYSGQIIPDSTVERLSSFGARAKLFRGGVDGELPLADGSQDLLLTCYALESMRMDHLYMACSEARRVVKKGGLWALLAHDPGAGFVERLLASAWRKAGIPQLDLTHYISPEDWHTTADQKNSHRGLVSRFLILRRLETL